jgi:hypothetical protein
MELIYKEFPDSYTIVDTSDWHLGSINCNKGSIQTLIQSIKRRKNCFVYIKGDLIDAILPADKRYAHASMDIGAELLTPQQQAEEVVKMLRPIADRIITVSLGNHEYSVINTFNVAKYICDHLDVRYGGLHFKIIAHDNRGEVMHKIFGTHGSGSLPKGAKDPIQRIANQKAALKRKLEQLMGDCIYMSMGHTHQLLVTEPTINKEIIIVDDGEQLKQMYRTEVSQNKSWIPPEARWYGNSGSFLKTFSPPGQLSYAEAAMYPPSEIGFIELAIRDKQVVKVLKRIIE